jgi:hypothetical protein
VATQSLDLDAFREWTRIEARVMGRPDPPAARRSGTQVLGALGVAALQWTALAVLPFAALVRISVFLYLHHGYLVWPALAVGVACSAALVTIYAAWVWRRLTGQLRLRLLARRFALPLVLAYCGYALLYLSGAHAKSERVRTYYLALHPLLRVAVSTLTLADRDIVITDLARRPEDYRAMGLPVNDGSLHYVQSDGYAHAADVRTIGRSALKNRLVQLYFVAMGFDTLRHSGTADHLHVELAVR